jgi:hypothetical protein
VTGFARPPASSLLLLASRGAARSGDLQFRFALQRGRLRARGVGTSVADVGFQFDLSPASPTPEPSSIIQLGMGLFAAMASVRKRIAERRPWRQPGLAGGDRAFVEQFLLTATDPRPRNRRLFRHVDQGQGRPSPEPAPRRRSHQGGAAGTRRTGGIESDRVLAELEDLAFSCIARTRSSA